jgi:hypothetical protein
MLSGRTIATITVAVPTMYPPEAFPGYFYARDSDARTRLRRGRVGLRRRDARRTFRVRAISQSSNLGTDRMSARARGWHRKRVRPRAGCAAPIPVRWQRDDTEAAANAALTLVALALRQADLFDAQLKAGRSGRRPTPVRDRPS